MFTLIIKEYVLDNSLYIFTLGVEFNTIYNGIILQESKKLRHLIISYILSLYNIHKIKVKLTR